MWSAAARDQFRSRDMCALLSRRRCSCRVAQLGAFEGPTRLATPRYEVGNIGSQSEGEVAKTVARAASQTSDLKEDRRPLTRRSRMTRPEACRTGPGQAGRGPQQSATQRQMIRVSSSKSEDRSWPQFGRHPSVFGPSIDPPSIPNANAYTHTHTHRSCDLSDATRSACSAGFRYSPLRHQVKVKEVRDQQTRACVPPAGPFEGLSARTPRRVLCCGRVRTNNGRHRQ